MGPLEIGRGLEQLQRMMVASWSSIDGEIVAAEEVVEEGDVNMSSRVTRGHKKECLGRARSMKVHALKPKEENLE